MFNPESHSFSSVCALDKHKMFVGLNITIYLNTNKQYFFSLNV